MRDKSEEDHQQKNHEETCQKHNDKFKENSVILSFLFFF